MDGTFMGDSSVSITLSLCLSSLFLRGVGIFSSGNCDQELVPKTACLPFCAISMQLIFPENEENLFLATGMPLTVNVSSSLEDLSQITIIPSDERDTISTPWLTSKCLIKRPFETE
eukprot:TRINITY_DN10989_c0_g1_i2.p1 TRINITY_DN10989_c0_g1~~TRINITY_DN10989_c0_g1_i2.p1  ORF type:complete len:116 (+),score=16.69 TRINITY_DN10989_c0_g1_i2:564-911(+)